MRFLTDFADLAELLPLATCVGVGLALAGWRRGALAWGGVIVGTLAFMLALKLLCLGCGTADALSPSGHTAAGTAIYGGGAALALRNRMPAPAAALLPGLLIASLIGGTRVALGYHVPAEVLIGGAAGLAAILLLLRAAGPPPPRLNTRYLLPAALLVVVALHGTRLSAEPRLRAVAGWLPAAMCDRLGFSEVNFR